MTWKELEAGRQRVGAVLTIESLDDQLNNILNSKTARFDALQKQRLIAIRKTLRTFLKTFYKNMNDQAELDMNEKSATLTEIAQFISIVNVQDIDVLNKVYADIEKQYTEVSKKNFESNQQQDAQQ